MTCLVMKPLVEKNVFFGNRLAHLLQCLDTKNFHFQVLKQYCCFKGTVHFKLLISSNLSIQTNETVSLEAGRFSRHQKHNPDCLVFMLTSFYCHAVQKLPNYKYCCHSFTSLITILRKYLGISKILHALCNIAGIKAPRPSSTVQVKMGTILPQK